MAPRALRSYSAGFDFVFAKPYWQHNPAATVTESDGVSFESTQTREFGYDFQVSPRVWLEYQASEEIGVRVTYWQFDQDPALYSTNPPPNGFGRIEHPAFGGVDISTTIPAETFTASSYLTVHSLDLDVAKTLSMGSWDLLATAGLRYAELNQGYQARLTNALDVTSGTIDYSHQFRGLGPALGIETRRPVSSSLDFFASARGALLIGGADANLAAGEDLDLANPFHTSSVSSRDIVMPVGDLKIGVNWLPMTGRAFKPFARVAVESQVWGGAGNASSEEGNLGFLGLVLGGGVQY